MGIGTTAPGYKLDVSGTGRFTDYLNPLGGISMNDQPIYFKGTSGSDTVHGIKYISSPLDGIQLFTNSGFVFTTAAGGTANRMMINGADLGLGGTITDSAFAGASVVIKSGNIGIGSTSPLGILYVIGNSSVLLRAGQSSLQSSGGTTSTTADIELAAADRIDLFAGSLSLNTSSTTAGTMQLVS